MISYSIFRFLDRILNVGLFFDIYFDAALEYLFLTSIEDVLIILLVFLDFSCYKISGC